MAEKSRRSIKPYLVAIAVLLLIGVAIWGFSVLVKNSAVEEADYALGTADFAEVPFDEPYVEHGAESGAPVVELYLDFGCPHCAKFEEVNGSTLREAVAQEKVTLRVYPRAFLAPQSSTEYSTRAAIAFIEVHKADPDKSLEYAERMFSGDPESAKRGLSNLELEELAREVGSDAPVADAIVRGKYQLWLRLQVEDAAKANTDGGTPYVSVDGARLEDWSNPENLKSLIGLTG